VKRIKDVAKAKKKGKRGRKYKSPTLEVDILKLKAKVARISEALELVRALARYRLPL
jgi:hypothetical protein